MPRTVLLLIRISRTVLAFHLSGYYSIGVTASACGPFYPRQCPMKRPWNQLARREWDEHGLISSSKPGFCSRADRRRANAPSLYNAASLTTRCLVWWLGLRFSPDRDNPVRWRAPRPGMVLSTSGSPTVLYCLTSCTTPLGINGSTWQLSAASSGSGTLRARPRTSQNSLSRGTKTLGQDCNIQLGGSPDDGLQMMRTTVFKKGISGH